MTEYRAVADEVSAPFFAGAGEGRLLIRRCERCGEHAAPYSFLGTLPSACTSCGSPELGWVEAEGRGVLVTWTVVHGASTAGDPAAHRGVGVVELAEGPWLFAPLAERDHDLLRVGAEMVVDFERIGGGEPIPVLRALEQREPPCS